MFAELADPAALARLDKRYQMENTRFRWDYRRDLSDRDLHDYAFQKRGADLAAAGCACPDAHTKRADPALR